MRESPILHDRGAHENGANGTDPAVIGQGYISASDSNIGFRWKGGVITELGLLGGGVYTMPYAVSSDGSTVVGLTGSNSFQQAFIWTDSNKLRTVVDEMKARGLELAADLGLAERRLHVGRRQDDRGQPTH